MAGKKAPRMVEKYGSMTERYKSLGAKKKHEKGEGRKGEVGEKMMIKKGKKK
jgi:hypothetical protein